MRKPISTQYYLQKAFVSITKAIAIYEQQITDGSVSQNPQFGTQIEQLQNLITRLRNLSIAYELTQGLSGKHVAARYQLSEASVSHIKKRYLILNGV